MKRFLIAALAALALAACSSTPDTGAQQDAAPTENKQPGSADVKTVEAGKVDGSNLDILTNPKSILSKRSIYFDYDSFVVREEFGGLIEAHAKFLVANPSMRMLIQGNTDERGSREYNIALGQKRADAVKKALMLLGAKEGQIESVSLGEEKPKDAGHDEQAWAENRRGDMLYSGEF